MDSFPDPKHLEYQQPAPSSPTRAVPRHRAGQRFLRGPIPWNWLLVAARLPGHALHVGVFLWYRAGLESQSEVRLSVKKVLALGVSRSAAYRGLAALEGSGLVAVRRHRGRMPVVTILSGPGVVS